MHHDGANQTLIVYECEPTRIKYDDTKVCVCVCFADE